MSIWESLVLEPCISLACSTKPIMKQRAKVVPEASGTVLEIGCGSGTNFSLYDSEKVTHLHAVEPAGGMIKRARKSAAKHGLSDKVDFHETGAEALPLEDDSVDSVVVTFVLCTIPDWQGALNEARRVLKPGGQLLFSEHGAAPDASVAKWQRRVEPTWKKLLGGCHLTRNVDDMLTTGGFAFDRHEAMYLPSSLKFASYVSWGSAKPI